MSLSSEHADFNPLFVFPCYGKRPVFGFKWRENSTNDPLEIVRLKRKYPSAVWAIDLEKSGLLCIDCDKDGDNVGLKWLEGFCGADYLNKVPGAFSPSGGRHCYFKNPKGLGCSRGGLPNKDVANIDVKGVGGYVIMPGQTTPGPDGGYYAPIGDLADASELPDNLAKLLAGRERHPSEGVTAEIINLVPESRGTPWAMAALEAICAELVAAPAGNRNNEATRLGFKAGQLLEQGRISLEEAYSRLEAAALSWGIPASDKCLGRSGTLWRALEAGMKSPRGPDDKDEGGPDIKFGLSKAQEEEPKEEAPEDGPEAKTDPSRLCWHGVDQVDATHTWLVEKFLPEVGVVLLSGQPKKGKSLVALDISGSVMTGLDAVTRKVTRRGGVLFIALPTEGNDEVPVRLRGLVEGKLRAEAVDAPEGYLDRLPFAWLREGENDVNLQDQASLRKLQADIDEAAAYIQAQYGLPLALIVVDALEAAGKFGDGYKGNEAKKVMTICDQIAAYTKCCVLVLDHFGKDEEQGTLGSIHKEGGVKVILSIRGKTLSVRGSRMTEQGPKTARKFELETVKFANGDSTSVVRWKEAGAVEPLGEDDPVIGGMIAAGKAKQAAIDRWPKHLRVFRRAMKEAMRTGGERHPIHGRPMARLENVRAQFEKDRLGDDDKKTVQRAFQRALNGVDAESLVSKLSMDESEYLYFSHTDDEK